MDEIIPWFNVAGFRMSYIILYILCSACFGLMLAVARLMDKLKVQEEQYIDLWEQYEEIASKDIAGLKARIEFEDQCG